MNTELSFVLEPVFLGLKLFSASDAELAAAFVAIAVSDKYIFSCIGPASHNALWLEAEMDYNDVFCDSKAITGAVAAAPSGTDGVGSGQLLHDLRNFFRILASCFGNYGSYC